MTYSRGTDNDKGAARIIYKDGRPLVGAYFKDTSSKDLDELVRKANAADSPIDRHTYAMNASWGRTVADLEQRLAAARATTNSLIDALAMARESLQRQILNGTCGAGILVPIDAALHAALSDARPIPSPAAPNR